MQDSELRDGEISDLRLAQKLRFKRRFKNVVHIPPLLTEAIDANDVKFCYVFVGGPNRLIIEVIRNGK